MLGLAPIIPGGPIMIRLVLIIPDHFQVLLGLAPIIPGGLIKIRLVLIVPDLIRVSFGHCAYHSRRSGLDKACTNHSHALPGLVRAMHLSLLVVRP